MEDILGKFTFVVELLLAQTALLYSYPKRKKFFLRIGIGYLICIGVAVGLYFIPYTPKPWFMALHLLRMLLIIGMTIGAAYFSYDCKLGAVFSACIGGEAIQHIGYHFATLISLFPFLPEMNIYTEFLCCVLTAAIAFWTVGRSAKKNCYYKNYDRRMIVVSVVIVAMCIGITSLWRLSRDADPYAIVTVSLYAMVCNVLAVLIQYFLYRFALAVSSNIVLQRINEEGRKQYELSRENMELLNQKCHDLKHKLVSLGDRLPRDEVDSMKESIELYDCFFKTGNDAFDVILNEKMLRCLRGGIAFTFMGDGRSLAFMNVMDIYSFFGNALDNSIEAVEGIAEAGRRQISLTVERRGDFVNVNVINYTDGVVNLSDGLPETTKTGEQGYHGFGLKSMRNIAQKYGGDLNVSHENGMFRLNVYMLDKDRSALPA